jgi:hypothetical protein
MICFVVLLCSNELLCCGVPKKRATTCWSFNLVVFLVFIGFRHYKEKNCYKCSSSWNSMLAFIHWLSCNSFYRAKHKIVNNDMV